MSTASLQRRLEDDIDRAAQALLRRQRDDGHWVFELEADATIPSEYVLLRHYLGEPDDLELERKIGVYLRRIQGEHGGWPLFHDGAFDISATVKAYFCLKMIGDSPDAPHMAKARDAILARGGAEQANVFTRILLALFGQLPWAHVPTMPVEMILLPRWFPIHLSKMSYWARTVIVPLLVLAALRKRARNPRGVGIQELFATARRSERRLAPHQHRGWALFFSALDRVLKAAEPLWPKKTAQRAIDRCVGFVTERLNGEDGLGAIYPAMANSVMMFDALGYPADHPGYAHGPPVGRQAAGGPRRRSLLPALRLAGVGHRAREPALLEVQERRGGGCRAARAQLAETAAGAGREGRLERATARGASRRLGLPVPQRALSRSRRHRRRRHGDGPRAAPIRRGARATTRRSRAASNGSPACRAATAAGRAFDADNVYHYLNNIPFADHGALLDPPTADVSARCIGMLAQLGETPASPVMRAGLDYLERDQMPDGSWFGRWGVNYIYGTWSALCALNAAGFDRHEAECRARPRTG